MLSKIENGMTFAVPRHAKGKPSHALHVPVTAFFRKYEEEERDATFVKAGQGAQHRTPGHPGGASVSAARPFGPPAAGRLEPYIITPSRRIPTFFRCLFQHEGIEFIYMLEGEVGYRHGNRTYVLLPGDSLFFDADVPHGPEELRKLPIRFLSVITYHMREPSG